MLILAWPWLAPVALLPVLACRWLSPALEPALRVPFFAAVRDAAPARRPRARLWLAIAAWALLVLASCRPQWLEPPVPLSVTGRSTLLALDVSASMGQADLRIGTGGASTRLQAVQRTAREFIARRDGDRVGLLLFGSEAYVLSPLSFDRQSVAAMVDGATMGVAGDLTALGDAIGLAVTRLRSLPASQRVMILLTDGASTAGRIPPLFAARLADHHEIRIHTIGVGARGDAVPGGADQRTLGRIARITGGRHFRAADPGALERIYRELDALEPVAGTLRLQPVRELYPWPLAGSLLLAVGVLLAPRLQGRGQWPAADAHPSGARGRPAGA